MPFYRITVTDIYGHITQGVRQDHVVDIGMYYEKAKQKAITAMKAKFKTINVVMVTSNSDDVKEYMKAIKEARISMAAM
ncbi:hypothetical protein CJD36_003755 [Flavipsychrobacter stenotrophus]|uniref:Uncharacterized protein n=1 Tax=Flavipsychrobacter stenotrophus TaxID=2077091 RepID=A0A2S7T0Z9_9BACT|nr:hypothetical protein [Flavipsychrobacter stenotrophus]PQJ12870.1 hypothetical protein CJD36_003755 [Flavipsychrobacter stenotrophus]